MTSQIDQTVFPIERGKIAEIARALFDDSEVYRDPEAATAAGFDAIPTPPTISAIIDHWALSTADVAVALGLDLDQLLHGGTKWEYLAPLHAGDDVMATRSVVDTKTKTNDKGRTLTFLTIETSLTTTDQSQVLQRRVDTFIEIGK